MKTKRSKVSSQILILAMAGFALLVVAQMAQAQTVDSVTQPLVAQAATATVAQSNVGNQQNTPVQIMQTGMPQRGLGKRLLDDTSLTYYQQFLGPTADGNTSRTYNVFQEGIDTPGSGFAPMQSFHGFNIRHQINTNWAVGATVAMTNGYTKEVDNKDFRGDTFTNTPDTQFFNARAYVALPAARFSWATLYTTLSVEAPTSEISRDNEMKYGWVAAQSLALNIPSVRWNVGFMGQVYRMYYKNNVMAPPFEGGRPTPLQTLIVSGGPYANYRFSDKWMLGSVFTFDWDQRGVQSGTGDFNNNLPHRGRMSLTYFPQSIKYLQSVGLFAQALLKFRPETTALGADFSIRF